MAMESTAGKPTSQADLEARIAFLEGQLAREQAKAKTHEAKISWKISRKGVLCLYGLGKFPVALYVGQWEKLWDGPCFDGYEAILKAYGDGKTPFKGKDKDGEYTTFLARKVKPEDAAPATEPEGDGE